MRLGGKVEPGSEAWGEGGAWEMRLGGKGGLGMRLGGKGGPGNEAWGEGGAWK